MKKITLLFIILSNFAFSQTVDIDAIVRKVALETNDDKKVDLITGFYASEINNNPEFGIAMGLKLLKQAQLDKSLIEEASAYSALGQGYRLLGSNIKALQFHHKAIALAEKSGNMTVLAIAENQTANVYKDREEYGKAIKFYLAALKHAKSGKNESVKSWPMSNLGTVYLAENKLDSALLYSQKTYEIALKQKLNPAFVIVYLNLAGIHSKLGNGPLAVSYYNMIVKKSQSKQSQGYLNMAYAGLANHYYSLHQLDSAAFYAKKAITVVQHTNIFYLSSKPALLLSSIYEKTDCDSTLKYTRPLPIACFLQKPTSKFN